jgi:hypothetical protein
MEHRLVGWDGLHGTEAAAHPMAVLTPPEQGRFDGVLADLGPALRGPPPLVRVAAVFDETLVGAIGNRGGVDEERRHDTLVRGAFIVQRPGLGGGAHRETPSPDENLGGQARHVPGGRPGRCQRRGPLAQLVSDEHGLVVLLLVLGYHPEGETRVE